MRTRTSAHRSSDRMRRVASRPSMTGIRMSINTTSGWVRDDEVDGRCPVGGAADDVQVGCRVEQHLEPCADQSLVVDHRDADHRVATGVSIGSCDGEPEAAAGHGFGLDGAVEQGGPLADAGEAVTRAWRGRPGVGRSTVIADVDPQLGG